MNWRIGKIGGKRGRISKQRRVKSERKLKQKSGTDMCCPCEKTKSRNSGTEMTLVELLMSRGIHRHAFIE